MKKAYNDPELNLIRYDSADVIATSDGGISAYGEGGHEDEIVDE